VLAEADLITLKASDIAANYIGRFVSFQALQALSGFIAQCADNCDGDFGSLVATHEEKPLELWRPFLCSPTDLFTRARLNVPDSRANTLAAAVTELQLHPSVRPPQEQFAISALLSCLCCDATDANASGFQKSAFCCVTQKAFQSNGISDNFNLIVH
jgi:hypothetical protein